MARVSRCGIETVVDARGCEPSRLRDRRTLQSLFDALVTDLGLHPVGRPAWHRFPITHGHTGIWMLTESHLAVHTWPELGGICINLFCCRPRPLWNWTARLAEILGASDVEVRTVSRRYATPAAEETA